MGIHLITGTPTIKQSLLTLKYSFMKQLFFYISAGILAFAVYADTWTVSTVCGANDTGYSSAYR